MAVGSATRGPKRPTFGASPSSSGSTSTANTRIPTTPTIWLRTMAPTPTPNAPSSAAASALRETRSARSPSAGVGRSRNDRMANPSMDTVTEIAKERSSPAAAKASVFAARKRTRSGAASRELVIVWWRHSPLIPTTAKMRMKKLLVSDANTSTSTDSALGRVSVATSAVSRSEMPTAAPARPMAVRVVRSFRNSACSRAVMPPPR